MQEEIKRVYATITLPIDIYKNGEMKMIYEEMHIEMEMVDLDVDLDINDTEIQERIQNDEVENMKIFKKDYLFKKNKNRLNSTFRKNMKKNSLTKKNYTLINNII
jgi:hypothetical protein